MGVWRKPLVAVWASDNDVGRINEATPRRARLVLGWMTLRGHTVSVWNQPLTPTQPPTQAGQLMSTSHGAVAVLCMRLGR